MLEEDPTFIIPAANTSALRRRKKVSSSLRVPEVPELMRGYLKKPPLCCAVAGQSWTSTEATSIDSGVTSSKA